MQNISNETNYTGTAGAWKREILPQGQQTLTYLYKHLVSQMLKLFNNAKAKNIKKRKKKKAPKTMNKKSALGKYVW